MPKIGQLKTVIRKIKKYAKEMDSQIYVRMFENLCPRINLAKENGIDKSFVNA